MVDAQTQDRRRSRQDGGQEQSNTAAGQAELLPGASAAAVGQAGPVTEQVTYIPGEGDPVTTRWGGFVFTANKPVTINGHSGDPAKGECKPHERAKFDMIQAARKNKFFRVGDFDPKEAVKVEDDPVEPKTPEQYRAYAIAWGLKTDDLNIFDKRWASEEPLRMKCGVGTDDLDLLQSTIGPHRAELVKKAGFTQ